MGGYLKQNDLKKSYNIPLTQIFKRYTVFTKQHSARATVTISSTSAWHCCFNIATTTNLSTELIFFLKNCQLLFKSYRYLQKKKTKNKHKKKHLVTFYLWRASIAALEIWTLTISLNWCLTTHTHTHKHCSVWVGVCTFPAGGEVFCFWKTLQGSHGSKNSKNADHDHSFEGM